MIRCLAFVTLIWTSTVLANDLFSVRHEGNVKNNPLGIPGPDYWQQQINYNIDVAFFPEQKYLEATAQVTYRNHSPHTLYELWFELPQQRFRPDSLAHQVLAPDYHTTEKAGTDSLLITDTDGGALPVYWQDTFFKVSLPEPLPTGQSVALQFQWDLHYIHRLNPGNPRSGYETFEQGGSLFTSAQWFPRAVAFTDNGWSLYPFIKDAEFSLEVGDYNVQISAPEDFWVFGSGELQNPHLVMSQVQLEQWQQARKLQQFFVKPMDTEQRKFWQFQARQVRDFAFVAGNNLVVETKTQELGNKLTRINVAYPDTGRWLWHKYAFEAVEHSVLELQALLGNMPFQTLSVVNSVGIGMEYPGLKVVGFRGPDADIHGEPPQYTRTEKYDVIGGIIHEVAHAYFPMTVNSDERLEGFLDEGLASYLSYLVEQRWNPNFQSFYGQPYKVGRLMSRVGYMPPVTRADHNPRKLEMHYHIPAVAFRVLQKQIFKEGQFNNLLADFIKHWQGKRARFVDFQNFIHSQTGKDLKWFWRSWFYGSNAVDYAIERVEVRHFDKTPENVVPLMTAELDLTPIAVQLSSPKPLLDSREGQNQELQDLYSFQTDSVEAYDLDQFAVVPVGNSENVARDRKQIRSSAHRQKSIQLLSVKIANLGQVPMPLTIRFVFLDGRSVEQVLPADYWRSNLPSRWLDLYVQSDAHLQQVIIDPLLQSGDADLRNNVQIGGFHYVD